MGLCYVLYSNVDLRSITAWLPECNWLYVSVFLLCNVVAMYLRGLRWRLQLRAIGVNPTTWTMSRSIFGTYAVNLVFPRLGEVWRTAYISRTQSAPFSAVFGTMVADRLADTATVFLITACAFIGAHAEMGKFLANSNIGSMLTSWPLLAAVGAIIIAGIILSRSQRVRGFVKKTWSGFTVLFRMPHRGRWLLLTAGIWGCYVLSMYFSMLSFPPTASLVHSFGLGCVMLTFVFGSLAMAVPSNGGIGPWQGAIMLSLFNIYGLDDTLALTFATINLSASTILTIVLGIVTFLSMAKPSKKQGA